MTTVIDAEYYNQQLDQTTLQPVLDENGNPVMKTDIDCTLATVTVGLVGRLPLSKKYLQYSLPKRWHILHNSAELKDYDDYVLALIL